MSEQTIWNTLRSYGYNEYATAGIMANIEAESAYLSNNAQDGYGWNDEAYTNGVDGGTISRDKFAKDAIGYGLCQWTYYTRKYALYDRAKAKGVSISDEAMQLEHLQEELQTEYSSCYRDLLSASSAYDAAYSFCVKFENPANAQAQGVYRGNRATQIYAQYAGTEVTEVAEPTGSSTTDASESESGNIHVVKYGDKTWYGNAVQSLLKAHGYNIAVDMDVRDGTMSALEDFASQHGLDATEDFGQLIYLLFSE